MMLIPEGYVGVDVVVAARICAAAHGGQVVLSRTTRELVGASLPAGTSLRSLGDHRLKDVPEPQPLYQLVGEDLPEAFPPLSTLGGATLPTLHHRLVGRAEQLAGIEALLARRDVRLVTVTGPGGAGKSRLALEVAAEVATGRPVHLVGLASISDPALVPAAIARAIGARESPGRPLLQSVADALAGTRTLLYLDNLEHLAAAAGHVRALLDAVPDLDVLATSRAPLRLSGEHVVRVDPLPVDEAVELFLDLAETRGARLREAPAPEIREICTRLDCLPLAIELVTARLTFLSPAQLLEALDQGLSLELEGPRDLPERQRTLRATIDWSYGLLEEGQRELHGVLAVFAGGSTLEDARAVAGDPEGFLADLEALVLGSLVRGEAADGNVRLSMLETIREDALARLERDGQLEGLRRRHAELFLGRALVAEAGLHGTEQASWTDRLERELDNLRAALDWLLARDRIEDVLRAISALDRFWRAQAHLTETRDRLAAALERSGTVSARTRGLALRCSGHMAMGQSDWRGAVPLLEEAISLFRECGDEAEEVTTLSLLSFVALRLDDPERAAELAREALEVARVLGDDRSTIFALMALGDVAWVEGDHDRAVAQYEEAVTLSRGTGDPLLIVNAVYNLGMAAFQGSMLERATPAFEEALALGRDLHDAPHIAAAQFMLGHLDSLVGDVESAREHASESLALYTELEDDRSRARCLVILAAAAAGDGSFEEAARLLGAAEALRGDDPPDLFELRTLERFLGDLESRLGTAFDDLKIEGRGLDLDALTRKVVSAGIEE
jgi:predicted ATPase